jgi:uncharacterized radical SAM superfamily protein
VRRIKFYAPSLKRYQVNGFTQSSRPVFVGVSVTGRSCALNCHHCGKKLLQAMIPARTPDNFWRTCERLSRYGARGVLISGGVNADGRVPLERVLATVPRVKSALGLKVAAHTALSDPFQARRLAESGVDVVLTDVVGNTETVRVVYGLDSTAEAFGNSIKVLKEAGLRLAPHLVVGLHGGELLGERNALEMIAAVDPEAVVIVPLSPLPDTAFAQVDPPEVGHVIEMLHMARGLMPNAKLLLGCARPAGPYGDELGLAALDAEVDGMAYPSDAVIETCRERDIAFSFSEECCGLMAADAVLSGDFPATEELPTADDTE